eukprot:CAMPEP_0178466868 /NCGR_PEP_ID=MMETSP0689_2-20121128/52122_1 /TAXON_ID=160604 /ORGANISM="Amphidinium massartii, Strain CS-259" /LENGTH=121 /DNA_ID=CAMNT_0020093899 /DNA_START=229 /DNA_END=595 /DNA_ORIENTATION=+
MASCRSEAETSLVAGRAARAFHPWRTWWAARALVALLSDLPILALRPRWAWRPSGAFVAADHLLAVCSAVVVAGLDAVCGADVVNGKPSTSKGISLPSMLMAGRLAMKLSEMPGTLPNPGV